MSEQSLRKGFSADRNLIKNTSCAHPETHTYTHTHESILEMLFFLSGVKKAIGEIGVAIFPIQSTVLKQDRY